MPSAASAATTPNEPSTAATPSEANPAAAPSPIAELPRAALSAADVAGSASGPTPVVEESASEPTPVAEESREGSDPVSDPARASALAQGTLRMRIHELAAQERALKTGARPAGYKGQLIAAAVVGGVGLWTAGAAMWTGLVQNWCDCGDARPRTLGILMGSGYAAAGVAGIWALTLTSLRRSRMDRQQVHRLREERRGLEYEVRRLHRAYKQILITPSVSFRPIRVALRATF